MKVKLKFSSTPESDIKNIIRLWDSTWDSKTTSKQKQSHYDSLLKKYPKDVIEKAVEAYKERLPIDFVNSKKETINLREEFLKSIKYPSKD